MTTIDETLPCLTDAVARGELALAEIAAIMPQELEALYELAAQYLDAGRNQDAAAILGGLVLLFPFSARYWRALGIAQHRLLQLEEARASYEAALSLAPDHGWTSCFRAEIWIYLGQTEAAEQTLTQIAATTTHEPELIRRATQLLQRLEALRHCQIPRSPTTRLEGSPDEMSESRHFTLADSRPIPLERTDPLVFPSGPVPAEPDPEVERTACTHIMLRNQACRSTADEDVTLTQEIPTPSSRAPTPASPDVTATAVIPRRRSRRRVESKASASTPPEKTETAVIRRRARLWTRDETTLTQWPQTPSRK